MPPIGTRFCGIALVSLVPFQSYCSSAGRYRCRPCHERDLRYVRSVVARDCRTQDLACAGLGCNFSVSGEFSSADSFSLRMAQFEIWVEMLRELAAVDLLQLRCSNSAILFS